jgi:hypothetical protein
MLKAIDNSVCKGCYADKGRYIFPNVQNALERRFVALIEDPQEWGNNMIRLLNKLADMGETYFRWHDSGDLQGIRHLSEIARIAQEVPRMTFWLPTREYKTVRDYLAIHQQFPGNLTVRISQHMVNENIRAIVGDLPTSGVHTDKAPKGATVCPARTQENKCRECRACWSPSVAHVSYPKH